jgi:arylsulfatase A-like enzyme
VSWPEHIPQDEVRHQVALGYDWLPTVADLCSVAPPNVILDGKSLVAVIRSRQAPTPHEVVHWQHGSSWAVRSGDWKLLFDVFDTTRSAPGEQIPGHFLVNLRDDPSETVNRALDHAEVVDRLKRLRREWEADVRASETRR